MAAVAAIASLVTAGVAVKQTIEARKQRKKAQQERKKAETRQATLLAEEESEEERLRRRDEDRRRQRQRAVRQGGQRATLLTGPLGLPSERQTSGKTLLGT